MVILCPDGDIDILYHPSGDYYELTLEGKTISASYLIRSINKSEGTYGEIEMNGIKIRGQLNDEGSIIVSRQDPRE